MAENVISNVPKKAREFSVSPSGEKFVIPRKEEYAKEFQRVEKLVGKARVEGKEIVVVMGVGFVGSVMAAIIAIYPKARGGIRVNSSSAARDPAPEASGKSRFSTGESLPSKRKIPKSTR